VAPGTYRVSGSFHRGPDGSNNQGAERVLPNELRFCCGGLPKPPRIQS
jgi:hypothetical protein